MSDPSTDSERDTLDENVVFWGAILGFIMGVIAWFFQVPQRGEDTRRQLFGKGNNLRERIGAPDPIEESIKEGKALAQQFHTAGISASSNDDDE